MKRISEGQKVAILGAGGLAREVYGVCEEIGCKRILMVDKESRKSKGRFEIIGENECEKLDEQGYKFVIAVGDNEIRQKIYQKHKQSIEFTNVFHPTAEIRSKGKLSIGVGNIVVENVVVSENVRIGNFCIFNFNCTVGHDCIIEDFVTVSPGANVSGNVELKKGSYIGTNASIIQGKEDNKISIGKWSTVGLSSGVTKDVGDGTTVIGTPARPVLS